MRKHRLVLAATFALAGGVTGCSAHYDRACSGTHTFASDDQGKAAAAALDRIAQGTPHDKDTDLVKVWADKARGFAKDAGDVPLGRAFLRIAAGLDRASGSGFGPAERAKTDQDIANLSHVALNHCSAPAGQ